MKQVKMIWPTGGPGVGDGVALGVRVAVGVFVGGGVKVGVFVGGTGVVVLVGGRRVDSSCIGATDALSASISVGDGLAGVTDGVDVASGPLSCRSLPVTWAMPNDSPIASRKRYSKPIAERLNSSPITMATTLNLGL
jgi:hypothetical protein